jgi:hypothetical protein
MCCIIAAKIISRDNIGEKMRVSGIGINSSAMGYVNELKQLEQNLDDLVKMGYRVVELGVEQQNTIINGEIKFPISYLQYVFPHYTLNMLFNIISL